MKLELTEKDVLLLKLLFSILIAFLMIRFLVMPGLELYQEHSIQNEELENQVIEMQASIDGIPDLQKAVKRQKAELARRSEPYYAQMENRQVDELLTGMAMQHGLFPISMFLEDAAPEIPMAYLYAPAGEEPGDDPGETPEASSGGLAERKEALEDADARLEEDGEASGEDAEAAEDREYTTSGRYVLASVCTMTLRGEGANVFAFADALQRDPAIQVRAMHRNERTYMDTDFNVTDMPEVSFTLAVYMYDGALLGGGAAAAE